MNTRRDNLIIGLWGVYIAVITAFVLYAGLFQFFDMISMVYKTHIVGAERIAYDMGVYIMAASSFLVAITQVIAGGMGLLCIVMPLSSAKLKAFGKLLIVVQAMTIFRDYEWAYIRGSTFSYIHRSVLMFVFAYKLQAKARTSAPGYFPFLHCLRDFFAKR